MHKIEQYPATFHVHSIENASELEDVKLSPNVDEWIGIDQWISSAIEWKRNEIIRQQMSSHINKLRTLRFDYQR